MPINNNSNTLKWRVEQLERNYESLDKKMDNILTNHIPHLHESISSLKTRINVLTAVNVGAIILAIVINRLI